jgi:hypothetical protein
MNLTLVCDYNPDGSERPVWLLVDLDERLHVDSRKSLYVNVSEYRKEFVGTFSDENMGVSVCMNELVSGRNNREFGIDLLSLQCRIGEDFGSIQRLIILISNIVEILAMSQPILE